MTTFNTGYDTSIGSSIVTTKIKSAINESLIRGLLADTNLDIITSLKIKPVFVTGANNSEGEIPLFAHPILLDSTLNKKEIYLCTDVRPFLKQDRSEYEIKDGNKVIVRNHTEFNLAKSRAVMNLLWLTGSESQIKNNLLFAGTVYASWLGETISKRFALDPSDQMKIFIISHFFYQTLFLEESVFDSNTKERLAVHTIKASKAPAKYVFEILDQITSMSSIEDYCTNVKTILSNVRLKDLSAGFVITLISNSWFGMNSKEILAVALEHPPTWVAIVYTSLVERTFKNSTIAKISERFGKNNLGSDYVKSYVEMMQGNSESVGHGIYSHEELKFKPFE